MAEILRGSSIKRKTMGIMILASGMPLLVASAAFAIYEIVRARRGGTDFASSLLIIAAVFLVSLLLAIALSSILQREMTRPVLELAQRQDAMLNKQTMELETSNRELAALSYSVSHDLRAPLRTIEGFSEALAEDYDDKLDDTARDYLRRVRDAGARMEVLIESLLALSRLSREELRPERVNLSEIAESIAAKLNEGGGRDVHFRIQPGLHVEGDPRLLRTALEHLLGNAWKFTSRHPSAAIEMGREQIDGRDVLYVRDDGAGFDQTYAEKMFAPFQRFHPAEEFDGLGIGLAIVQRIVHRHHGRVWAVGRVEQGTTVYMEFE